MSVSLVKFIGDEGMKMSFWTIVWGSFFVLLGISIILKTFGVDLPIFRIALALFVIWVGVRILIPGKRFFEWCNISSQTGRETVFAESKISGQDVGGDYKVVFGAHELDLTQAVVSDNANNIRVHVVFGSSKIKIDRTKPIKISGNTAFGGIKFPNGNSVAFGRIDYTSDSYKPEAAHLSVDVDVVFGSVEIE